MNIVFVGLEIFDICVIAIALFFLLQGSGSREQKLMMCFLIGALIQNAGYLLEITAPTVEAAMVAVKVQYMGSLTIPITYCEFIFIYCFEKVPVKLLRFLKIVDVMILGLVLTCDLHSLYYHEVKWLETAQGHKYLSLTYGPGYGLFMVCGSIVPYAMSLYALLRVCIRKSEYDADRKYKLILGLSALPLVALVGYAMKLTDVYDPTPLVLGLTLSAVVILIWRRKVLDFSSMASEILLDSMSDGVIALDEQKRIVSYNPAAVSIFRDLDGSAIGKHVDELKDRAQTQLDYNTSGLLVNP